MVLDDVTEEDDDVAECRCRHDCEFSGPPVCGNDSVLYLNRCRMNAAACEKGIRIEEADRELCQGMRFNHQKR